jgi:hypothetical protein
MTKEQSKQLSMYAGRLGRQMEVLVDTLQHFGAFLKELEAHEETRLLENQYDEGSEPECEV